MLKRIWAVTHPLLTLAAVGCCTYLLTRPTAPLPSGRMSEDADFALRRFLGVKWIGGDYELPKGENHYAVVGLTFKDGKFVGRHGGAARSAEQTGSRVVPYTVMWGDTPNGLRVMSIEGSISSSWQGDEFFKNLDGGLSRTHGSSMLGEVRGYRIIGYIASRACQPGSEGHENSSGLGPDWQIQHRRYVFLLGIKPFASEQEARDWAYNVDEAAER